MKYDFFDVLILRYEVEIKNIRQGQVKTNLIKSFATSNLDTISNLFMPRKKMNKNKYRVSIDVSIKTLQINILMNKSQLPKKICFFSFPFFQNHMPIYVL